MTSQMFSAIAAVTGQGQNPNTTPAQWGSSQYGYGGSTGGGGGSSSAYHVSAAFNDDNHCGRNAFVLIDNGKHEALIQDALISSPADSRAFFSFFTSYEEKYWIKKQFDS